MCDRCVRSRGLCRKHARDVLPKLAEPKWLLALMGAKQSRRELTKADATAALAAAAAVGPLPVSPEGLTYRQRRAMTKAIKARKRRGRAGLVRSIRSMRAA